MTIDRYVPPAPPAPNDGLPLMLPLPPRDGLMRIKFIGKFSLTDAWSSETLVAFAKRYARAALVAQDMEVHVLRTERDALKAELDQLRGHGSR